MIDGGIRGTPSSTGEESHTGKNAASATPRAEGRAPVCVEPIQKHNSVKQEKRERKRRKHKPDERRNAHVNIIAGEKGK